ncbi:DUF1036 domain-containing protein [Yoonia sp. 2307UL14-13]|uniref:DUF1036 domain-containing protein n=1 Tax=Yoonia sp. 2307UL14-13 TaxID=3126506 RepID=UPI0030AECDCA
MILNLSRPLRLFCHICLLGLSLSPRPAHAQFSVCNQSFDVVNVAIGLFEEDGFVTRGWWTVGPNQCANVIRDELQSRYIYVFAQDVFGKEILRGTVSLCVAPDGFEVKGERDCVVDGLVPVDFIEVDTLETERWTLFLAPPP